MRSFDYIRAGNVGEAANALAHHGSDACILAGGTDLLIEFRRGNAKLPKVVVDVAGVAEMRGVDETDDTVVVGPLSTHAKIQHSPLIQRHASLLAAAASWIGSPQIRNRGTVGGNIMNAATCADTVPPLVALDAEITLQSASGHRTMNIADLFVKPYQTKALAEELLTEIRFKKLPTRSASAFIKLGRRNALSISRLSVAAVVCRNEHGVITDARIVPGAVFPTWRRVAEAESMLLGEHPSHELFRAVGNTVSEVMISATGRRWSTEYKEPVLAVLVRRSLEQCVTE